MAAELDTSSPVLLDVSGAVATITLNRPASFNAINLALAQGLRLAIADVAASPAVRVLILRGAGRSFCGGGDVAAMHAHQADRLAFIEQIIDLVHGSVLALHRLSVPVIAQVHGAVAGGGFSLALAADLSLAARSSRFVVAYPQLGTSCDGGLSFALTQRLGALRAFELLTLQGKLDADGALALGLVNAVVDDGELDAQAAQWAQTLIGLPLLSVRELKGLVAGPLHDALEAQLQREKAAFLRCAASDEFAARVAAFANKHASTA